MANNNNILGLPPINPGYGFGLTPYEGNAEGQALPKNEIKEINQDSIRRRVAIETVASNNEKGIKLILKMDQDSFAFFYNSTQFVIEMNEESHGTAYQKYCDAFSDRLIKVMAHHTFGLLEAGAARIAYEINRPPQLDEETKGLAKFLFG